MPLHLERAKELTEAERWEIWQSFFEYYDLPLAVSDALENHPHADVEEIRALLLGVAQMEEDEAESGQHDAELQELYREHAALLREAADALTQDLD